ncbi:MAG TPA: hypothetical protein VJP79_08820 [Nitrososphaera sp.]|nr:hypothetical protein [Nitrososphaera sp.]
MLSTKTAAQRGGVIKVQTREGLLGPITRTTYRNGDWEESVCNECWQNFYNPRILKKNGGKFVKCQDCHIRDLVKARKVN